MGSVLRNSFVASLAALTIGAGTFAAPGTALARKGRPGLRDEFASPGFGRGALYVEHYGYGFGVREYGWGLDRLMAATYNAPGSYLGGDYSIYPYGSW
jgi:hypothetical protein